MVAKGYMGKILRVDLSRRKVIIEDTEEEQAKKYIGGSGLGAKILFEETSVETNPLGSENLLIFAVGLLTGTRVFSSDRSEVIAKSPATGIYCEANCGGHWGEKFKRCGYDALVIQGTAEAPVYLYIDEDQVQIKDASRLWSKDTFETTRVLKEERGESAQVAAIGKTGENLVKFAAIMTDGEHGRAAG